MRAMKMNAVSAGEKKATACSESPYVSMAEAEIDLTLVDHCGRVELRVRGPSSTRSALATYSDRTSKTLLDS
jgi:hypothetical protein